MSTSHRPINKITRASLENLPLEDFVGPLEKALSKNFKNALVEVIDCPDLSVKPWDLKSKGICGSCKIADVGGVDNLHYPENNFANFSLEDVSKAVEVPKGFVMGPGAGNPHNVGVNSELIANSNQSTHQCGSKYAIVKEDGKYVLDDYKWNDVGMLANLLVTEGKQDKVIHVKVSVRSGDLNFVSCLRRALAENFPEKALGFAGVFQLSKGKIKAHVMPDFPKKDMLCGKVVDEWLRFYEMSAPLTCLSVFLSKDQNNLGFRLEHTHFFSEHGDGGHYHNDTTPDEVEYDGYFVPCEAAYRIEPPFIDPQRTAFFQ